MEDEDYFDLSTINEYELLSNEDGTVVSQDNCVVIKHIQSKALKMLPMTEEVLQLVGLAVMLDEDDVKVSQEHVKGTQEDVKVTQEDVKVTQEDVKVTQEDVKVTHEEMEQHNYEAMIIETETQKKDVDLNQSILIEPTLINIDRAQTTDGQITIVFTDDEDAEMAKFAAEANSSNTSDQIRGPLMWWPKMVDRLLELYEENHERFYQPHLTQREVWEEIYTVLAAEFPTLRNYNAKSVRSKFDSLKRTYRVATDYLKTDVNSTKWEYFERMDKLMREKQQYESVLPSKKRRSGQRSAPENNAAGRDAGRGGGGAGAWQRRWTPQLLDTYEECVAEGTATSATHFWTDVRNKMTLTEPHVARVSPAQLQQKFLELRQAYLDSVRSGKIRKCLSRELYERLERVHADSSEPDDASPDNDVTEPEYVLPHYDAPDDDVTYGDEPAAAATPGDDNATDHTPWPDSYTDLFLDLYIRSKPRISQGVSMHKIYREISVRMRERLGARCRVTPLQCQRRAAALRGAVHAGDTAAAGPHYQKAVRAFDKPVGGGGGGGGVSVWSRARAALLLDVYEATRRRLHPTSSKFWETLAHRFNQERGGGAGGAGRAVSAHTCEMKMQALFLKYKAAQRRGAHYAARWPLYTKMERIFGGKSSTWPDRSVQLLLALYQNNLTRLERGDNVDDVWETIASTINKVHSKDGLVSADSCKDKVTELKRKYCLMLRDTRAAQTWPLFKRMSEVLSIHLWSKSNVHLLLDTYERVSPRLRVAPPRARPALWDHIADMFNEQSRTSAVIGPQCQTEMHVLKAKYKALVASGNAENNFWPFFKRLHQICSREAAESERADESDDTARSTRSKRAADDDESGEYVWTETSTRRLLALYQSHRHMFGTRPRAAVWMTIDRELQWADPSYTPSRRGHGGWRQYRRIMASYMDIKEGRCIVMDWPYYQIMEDIFSSKPEGGEEGAMSGRGVSPAASDDTDSGPDSDKLQDILLKCYPGPSAKRKRQKGSERESRGDESAASCSSGAGADLTPNRTMDHRVQDEGQLVALLDAAGSLGARPDAGEAAWRGVARRLRTARPDVTWSRAECRLLVADMHAAYQRMQRQGAGVPIMQRLTPRLYKKMSELDDVTVTSSSKETGPAPDDLLQRVLAELRRKNELSQQRCEVARRRSEDARREHREKMDLLKKIYDTLRHLVGDDRSDLLAALEKTLEEIHA